MASSRLLLLLLAAQAQLWVMQPMPLNALQQGHQQLTPSQQAMAAACPRDRSRGS